MENKTNVGVLQKYQTMMATRLSRMTQAALRYFGHVVRHERGIENDVMIEGMSGKRMRETHYKMGCWRF